MPGTLFLGTLQHSKSQSFAYLEQDRNFHDGEVKLGLRQLAWKEGCHERVRSGCEGQQSQQHKVCCRDRKFSKIIKFTSSSSTNQVQRPSIPFC